MSDRQNSDSLAVLMLACRDYESMELALACHMRYSPDNIPYFILQNCRGNYDAERTLEVARRYQKLFPHRISVIDDIAPGTPYASIDAALSSARLSSYKYICKVDDDAFPITEGWIVDLLAAFQEWKGRFGNELAYVTPLINNNTWGFTQVLSAMGLEEEYYSQIARVHTAGNDTSGDTPMRILPRTEIAVGVDGTIWGYPYMARWLHEKTTLQPDRFVEGVRGLSDTEVSAAHRYSIGCILFESSLWSKIKDDSGDDEAMMLRYCKKNNLKIGARRSIPFVHMAYFSQREENRDIVESARNFYQERLGHPFPIGLRQSRLLELESRLRWLERDAAHSIPSCNFGLTGRTRKRKRGRFRRLISKISW